MSLPMAEEFRAEMGRQRVSGPDLAERSGVNVTTVWRKIQKGERPLNVEEADRMSAALGLPLSEIIIRAERARENKEGATYSTSDALGNNKKAGHFND